MGQNIYFYGGCDITFSVFYNDLWLLQINRQTHKKAFWKHIPTFGEIPSGSCGHGAIILNNTMYTYGGLVTSGISSKLYSLDLSTYTWKQVSALPHPNSRALIQHSMTRTGEFTFVLGSGTSANKNDDDSAYELSLIHI